MTSQHIPQLPLDAMTMTSDSSTPNHHCEQCSQGGGREQWGGEDGYYEDDKQEGVLSVLNPTYLPCYITSPYSHSHTTTYLHTSIVSPYKGYIHGLLH